MQRYYRKLHRSILPNMIRVRGLTHRFGDNTVLSDISLQVSKGETVAVMGGSGVGKTTLLRCMAGLLRPTDGEVELFGKDLYNSGERETEELLCRLGVVFQGAALFDYLSVRDNVAFGVVRHSRLSNHDVDELVSERLKMVGLSGTEHLMPGELSGGMKKRVGLARALAMDPELLFYDEPTSGLDPITAYSIDGLIKEIGSTLHNTSVLVTHNLQSLLRVADRVIFLHDGRIITDSPPEEFKDSKDALIREVIDKAESASLA